MTAPTFEPIPLPVARLDAIRHLVEVNPAWVELFANAEAAQVGRCFDEIISGRDAAGQRAYRHGLSTQKSGRFSFYASIETAATPTLMYLRLCRVDSGWFVLAEPVHHDDVNAELLSERERWRSVLHGASEGIAVLDDQGRFVEVNTRFLDLVAPRAPRGALLDDQGIIGWSLMEVVPAPLALALGARLAGGLHRRSLVTRVVVGATHLELTVSSTSLAGGRFTGTCLTVHDRTADHRLREVNSELSASLAFLEELYRVLPGVLLVFDSDGVVTRVNEAAHTVLGYDTNTLVGRPVAALFPAAAPISFAEVVATRVLKGERNLISRTGETIPIILCAAVCGTADLPAGQRGGGFSGQSVVCVALDIRDRRRLEMELRQAQKLESVGRLAAGVAHEINTPVQFVSDSIAFLRDATNDILDVVDKLQAVRRSVLDGAPSPEAAAIAVEAEEAADLPYLLDNVPKAFDRCVDGLARVANIVGSMKEFAHPDQREMSMVDLSRAIESTLTIARGEYKFVADVETDYGDLPLLLCHAGDINQVVLNLVVNAAHAIGDVVSGTEHKGRITIRTRVDGDHVVISIGDTGGGIPEHVKHCIYDPFFTTKEVGKGTGQGLAIARSVVVDKHRGELSFESEVGRGTTFFIRLPLVGSEAPASDLGEAA